MLLHVAVVPAEQYYKSGVYVLCVRGAVLFGARGGGGAEHACEVGVPDALVQH